MDLTRERTGCVCDGRVRSFAEMKTIGGRPVYLFSEVLFSRIPNFLIGLIVREPVTCDSPESTPGVSPLVTLPGACPPSLPCRFAVCRTRIKH